ncbi:MAG: haloacid dehalogenase-like hydrolase [Chloroflexota bacterium]|nr:haloacid dehalogenase-like hydrolase [Chloroflexota bacterium]
MVRRLLLFDIDGTLVLTRGAGREATKYAMQDIFGTHGSIDTHTFGGKTDWTTLIELLTPHGFNADAIGDHLPRYIESMGQHLARVIVGYPVIPCPGALETVAALRERDDLAFGIVTGNVRTSAPVKLRAAGFDPAWFPVGAYGDEAISRDDLPALALQRARTTFAHDFALDQVFVIGDTPADIQCARACGAVAVAVRTGFGTQDDLSACQPDYLFDDLRDLLTIL